MGGGDGGGDGVGDGVGGQFGLCSASSVILSVLEEQYSLYTHVCMIMNNKIMYLYTDRAHLFSVGPCSSVDHAARHPVHSSAHLLSHQLYANLHSY